MKKILLLAFIFISNLSFAQGITCLIMKDKNQWEQLTIKRNGNRVWIPTWDNDGRAFFMPAILNDPYISDYVCLFDSLTDEGIYLPLSENLRFANSLDKLAFIEFAETAGAFVQQNNIGDVIINNSMYELFDLYPAVYEDVITKAEVIDRYVELLNSGAIWPIPYPANNTPSYTGCN